ncbi:MAG: trypsin-like peptidase domain-containing protein, partial [Oscillospiraceae bacterium]|nr:trypsin-like peptidase domain-containing protein [Oscillospiraceae bacterium]
TANFEAGSPWYLPYADYCRNQKLAAGAYRNYNAPATRADFAVIVGGALPDEAITPINRIADGAIPDVAESYSYGSAVYKLYRAGVLTGIDEEGSYYPGKTLKRAEAAAIIMRILDADTRERLTFEMEMSAEMIYAHASPAVFFIEIFDSDGDPVKTGSGFFISETGLAVTNYHVIVGGSSARITTDDGEEFKVAGIFDYDWKTDVALISVEGEQFPYLEIQDFGRLRTGATVYALGSPLGLQASFSKGIVSQILREIEGALYIQIDAPISSGSSGGALLDTRGRVIGITSATAVDAQNINLSVPIGFINGMNRESAAPLESIRADIACYEDKNPAPDFGAYSGAKPFRTEDLYGGTVYSYRLSDMTGDADDIIDGYTHLLWQNLFVPTAHSTHERNEFQVFYNSKHSVQVEIGYEKNNDQECFTVIVTLMGDMYSDDWD